MDGSMKDYTGSYAKNAFGGAGNPPSGVLPTPPDTIEDSKSPLPDRLPTSTAPADRKSRW